MSYTLSPNMFLRIPTVGSDAGPDYANNLNFDLLSIIDTHDHTSGKGVQITPAGLNINTDLNMNSHSLTDAAGILLVAQSVTPTSNTIYEAGVDLYFVDGLGNNVRITQSGALAGTPGSISGLVAPASASYVPGSQTFIFQSNTSIAANIDAASYLFRNISPNSTFAITVAPPAALSSNYSLQLPTIPVAESFMSLDTSGIMQTHWTVDNSTIKITGNQLVAQGQNIPNASREHNWELNGKYASLTFPLLNIDAVFFAPYNLVINSVWIYNGNAGSGGTTEYDLKVKNPGGSYASILSTTGKITSAAAADIYTDSGSVVTGQTGVTKPVITTANITAGQAIKFDLIQSMTGTPTDARIRIYWTQQ